MVSVEDDVHNYLDSTISTYDDLGLNRIQSLLQTKQEEQTALNNKLPILTENTRHILSESLHQTNSQQSTLHNLSLSLEHLDRSIEEFIPTPTSTQVDDTRLLSRIKRLESKLSVVDNAKIYIKALLVSAELSAQAIDLVQTTPELSLMPYMQLVKLERYIKEHSHYQELANHLHLPQLRLWDDLKTTLTSNFKNTLDKLTWPTPIKAPYGPQLRMSIREFEKAFQHLLLLQLSSETESASHSVYLMPISIMLESISLRFRYHFETSKPTNRIDKPEWYLTHVRNSISAHMPFIMSIIQPIIENMQELKERVIVKDYFITGLLEDVARKLRKTMPQLLKHSNWLSHTVHEILEFDKSLVDEYAYKGVMVVSNVILGNPVWFKTWFEGERKFAQSKYDEMMMDGNAFTIYAEDHLMKTNDDPQSMQRTVSSVKLLSLIESVVNAYRLIPDITQKMMFCIEIQLNLLRQYHKRLSNAIDSFEALSLIRSVPVPGALPDAVTGIVTASEVGGTIAAYNRLYRWWTSARSIMNEIKEWTDDEFYLDLFYEINKDPESIRYLVEHKTAQNDFISFTSISEYHLDGLFRDALTAYKQLDDQIKKIFVKIAVKEWNTDTRLYAKRWNTLEDSVSNEISEELYMPLQNISTTFNYLHTILPHQDFMSVYKKTMKEIEEWYWKNIITYSQFSPNNIQQLDADLRMGLWKIGRRWVNKPENFTKRLKETMQLLTYTFPSDIDHDDMTYDVVMRSLNDTHINRIQTWLNKIGIEVLNSSQIRDVLRRRNDMLHSWK